MYEETARVTGFPSFFLHLPTGAIPEDSSTSASELKSPTSTATITAPGSSTLNEKAAAATAATGGRRSASPFSRNAFRARSGNKRLTAFSTAMESIEAKAEPVEIEPADPENSTL